MPFSNKRHLHFQVFRIVFFIIIFLSFSFFSFSQLRITGFSPKNGMVGDVVNISGSGFSSTPSVNIVRFGISKAAVLSATTSNLTVVVPKGYSNEPINVTVNGNSAFSNIPFDVVFSGASTKFNSGSLGIITKIRSLYNANQIKVVDMDGDEKPDIVVASYNSICFLKNMGSNNNFELKKKIDINAETFCEFGDIDSDGKLDFLFKAGVNTCIARNNSTTDSFSFSIITLPYNIKWQNAKVVELDNDGRPDLLLCNSTENSSILRNLSTPGNIAFDSVVIIIPQRGYYTVCDINNNGKADIICLDNYYLRIIENLSEPGEILFKENFNLYLEKQSFVSAIEADDLNNDGFPDIAISRFERFANSNVISILKNKSTPEKISFEMPLEINTIITPGDIKIADIDGDGKNDISCSMHDPRNQNGLKGGAIIKNIGDSIFLFDSIVHYSNLDYKFHKLAVVDLTNDGRLDIVALNKDSGIIYIYPNKVGNKPLITSVEPKSGGEGTIVTIKGENLINTSSVSFGGTSAKLVTIISDSVISAMVGTGTTGNINVVTHIATASYPGFIYKAKPGPITFYPLSGRVGQKVKITGTNFNANPIENVVYFGETKAKLLSATNNVLYVEVPAYAPSFAPISVNTNGFTIQSRRSFNITFINGGVIDSSLFKAMYLSEGLPFNKDEIYPVYIADIDSDGKSDLVFNVNDDYDKTCIFRNTTVNGIVSFKNIPLNYDGTIMSSVVDIDGDGKLDMLGYNMWGYLNKSIGDSIFFEKQAINMPPFTRANDFIIADKDIDGDGRPDIIVLVNWGFAVIRNNSTPGKVSYEAAIEFQGDRNSTNCTVNDFNEDEKPDIISAGFIFKNISTPGFVNFEKTFFDKSCICGTHTSSYFSGDFDKDGLPELVLFYNDTTQQRWFKVFKNNSINKAIILDSVFTMPSSGVGSVNILDDLNGDNKPDFAYGPYLSIYENISTSTNFSLLPSVQYSKFLSSCGGACPSYSISDISGDGRPDIVSSVGSLCYLPRSTFQAYINQNAKEKYTCINNIDSIVSIFSQSAYCQWQVNTGDGYVDIIDNENYLGTKKNVLYLKNIPSSWIGYQYRCKSSGNIGQPTSIQFANYWTGAIDSTWENTANWSCGVLPDGNTDVFINNGSIVKISSNIVVRSLQIDPDARLIISPNYNLIIKH